MISDFTAFLYEIGLRPTGVVVADGRVHRCPTEDHPRKKNGAYKLFPDGRFGWGRNHATHDNAVPWRPEKPLAIPPIPRAVLREQAAQARAERVAAIRAARAYYERCKPLLDGHSYLAAHGLDMTGCSGLRVDRDGRLVVPMLREGQILSLQRITPAGEKKFWYNAPSAGTRYVIERAGATLTVLCEGLATGLALFAAVPTARVVVAFTASNVVKVAEDLPRQGMMVVASDNDHRTVCQRHRQEGLQSPFEPWTDRPQWCRCNPGRCAARAAASLLGCGSAEPEGILGTDWCDFRRERLAAREAEQAGRRWKPGGAMLQRSVDAEIGGALMRAARFLVPSR